MGVRILEGNGQGDSIGACLYCSTSDWAFGPIFEDGQDAQAFLNWLPGDPRTLDDKILEQKFSEFTQLKEKVRSEAGGDFRGDLAWQNYMQDVLRAI